MKATQPFIRHHPDLASQAIRGREQNLIDANGARSMHGLSANKVNGISEFNPNRPAYMNAARRVFGFRYDVTTEGGAWRRTTSNPAPCPP